MKFIALLFSVYFLALSYMPCSDQNDCEYAGAKSELIADSDHSSHDADSEHCSPFCICACCGHIYGYENSAGDFGFKTPVSSQIIVTYQASFIPEVYLSIWQPPKLV